jgi:hypothetical protein
MNSRALGVVHAEKESNLREFTRVKSMKLGATNKDSPLLLGVVQRFDSEK